MNGIKTMGWGTLPLIAILLSGAPGAECGQPGTTTNTSNPPEERNAPAAPATMANDTGSWPYPFFGFNTKGRLDPGVQTRYANAFFDKITAPSIKSNLVVRVTGGTISQTTAGSDWTPEVIKDWTDLQKRQGIRFIYVVNGNDSPAEQAAAIQRWLDAGSHFDLLEMMNEYYLPKFAKGDRTKAEVTRQVTPEIYVDEILPTFWKELDRFHLPYYLIFAPEKGEGGGGDNRLAQWNEVVARATRNKWPERDLNATVHLYAHGGIGNYDYGQIDRIRQSLPAGRHIAITEAGVLDPGMTFQENGQAAVQHYRNILQHLGPGDYLLDQVLYNPGKRNNISALDRNGETNKGQIILQFIQNRLQ